MSPEMLFSQSQLDVPGFSDVVCSGQPEYPAGHAGKAHFPASTTQAALASTRAGSLFPIHPDSCRHIPYKSHPQNGPTQHRPLPADSIPCLCIGHDQCRYADAEASRSSAYRRDFQPRQRIWLQGGIYTSKVRTHTSSRALIAWISRVRSL